MLDEEEQRVLKCLPYRDNTDFFDPAFIEVDRFIAARDEMVDASETDAKDKAKDKDSDKAGGSPCRCPCFLHTAALSFTRALQLLQVAVVVLHFFKFL